LRGKKPTFGHAIPLKKTKAEKMRPLPKVKRKTMKFRPIISP
jgi:hypothetical protein